MCHWMSYIYFLRIYVRCHMMYDMFSIREINTEVFLKLKLQSEVVFQPLMLNHSVFISTWKLTYNSSLLSYSKLTVKKDEGADDFRRKTLAGGHSGGMVWCLSRGCWWRGSIGGLWPTLFLQHVSSLYCSSGESGLISPVPWETLIFWTIVLYYSTVSCAMP